MKNLFPFYVTITFATIAFLVFTILSSSLRGFHYNEFPLYPLPFIYEAGTEGSFPLTATVATESNDTRPHTLDLFK